MQLTGTKKIIGGLTLAAVVALASVVGLAQQQSNTQGQGGQERSEGQRGRDGKKGRRGMGGGGAFGGHFFKGLNLTEAQKAQMKQIAARYRESTKSLREQGRRARGGDSSFFNGGTFDEAAVRAKAQARAAAGVEMEVARARMMSEMYNVLTPEQKAQFAAQRQQREQKRQERRARRNATQGQSQ